MAGSVIDGLPQEQRDYLLALASEGVGGISAVRLLAARFGNAKINHQTYIRWAAKPETMAEIDAGTARVRQKAPDRTFADQKQQLHALVKIAETTWGLYLEETQEEKPNLSRLCKLGNEFRLTAQAIREASAPFQTQAADIIAPFEQIVAMMKKNTQGQPASVQKAFGAEPEN